MKELIIYEYQAKQIEDTLRIINNIMNCSKKESSADRQVIKSWEMIKNVLSEEPKKELVNKF